MRTIASVCLVFASLLVVHSTSSAPKTKNLVVKSTIADADVDLVPFSIQSDMLGTYQNGTSSVVSQIQGIGDWELDMLDSPTRRVGVSFNDPVPGTNPDNLPAPPNGYYPVRFITQCPTVGVKIQDLTLDQTEACPMIVAVDIGSTRYSLRFYSQNFPGSENVFVRCTAANSTGKCTNWRVDSADGANRDRIAQVFKVVRVGNHSTLTDYGKYYFSFQMSFTTL